MPKIKTHKSTAKRFRVTGKGKLMRTRTGKSHLRRKKSKRILGALDEMHEGGAVTIAQDEKSSVVWGMPGAAVKINAVDFVLPVTNIARKLIALYREE